MHHAEQANILGNQQQQLDATCVPLFQQQPSAQPAATCGFSEPFLGFCHPPGPPGLASPLFPQEILHRILIGQFRLRAGRWVAHSMLIRCQNATLQWQIYWQRIMHLNDFHTCVQIHLKMATYANGIFIVTAVGILGVLNSTEWQAYVGWRCTQAQW